MSEFIVVEPLYGYSYKKNVVLIKIRSFTLSCLIMSLNKARERKGSNFN